MHQFLPDITPQVIEQRNNKIKAALERQKILILEELNQKITDHLGKRKINRSQNEDSTFQCFKLFYVACQNLLNIYFPMLMDSNYISLQSESQINDKIIELRANLFKNLKALYDKSLMTRADWEKQFERRAKIENVPKRGRNSKTPLQSTEVLIKWLLCNFKNPYPSNAEKEELAQESNLQLAQVNNWFINARERVIKKYLKKETKQIGSKIENQSD